jgi:hypothetical protein
MWGFGSDAEVGALDDLTGTVSVAGGEDTRSRSTTLNVGERRRSEQPIPAQVDLELRSATVTERETLRQGNRLGRTVRERHAQKLRAGAGGRRTQALILAELELERQHAVEHEVQGGQVLVRNGPVPLEIVRAWEARRGEVVLVDAGEVRGVVLLDPQNHPTYAALLREWKTVAPQTHAGPWREVIRPDGTPGPLSMLPSPAAPAPSGEPR